MIKKMESRQSLNAPSGTSKRRQENQGSDNDLVGSWKSSLPSVEEIEAELKEEIEGRKG
jgi:hypothetical protein